MRLRGGGLEGGETIYSTGIFILVGVHMGCGAKNVVSVLGIDRPLLDISIRGQIGHVEEVYTRTVVSDGEMPDHFPDFRGKVSTEREGGIAGVV